MNLLRPFSDLEHAQVSDFWLVPNTCFDGVNLQTDLALHLRACAQTPNTASRHSSRIYHLIEICSVKELFNEFDARGKTQSNSPALFRWDGCISVGMFDIQINGGGGALFNNAPSLASLRTISRAHRASGTTAFLPTVITDSDEVMFAATDAVIESYTQSNTFGVSGILGIHFEGPHINQQKRGTHELHHIRQYKTSASDDAKQNSIETLTQKLRQHDIPVLITLAPECVATGNIARLVNMGAVVSIGHTSASAAQTQAALDEGAQCFTHLFNAMPTMTSRDPGVVGVALTSQAWCSMIADGHHVSDAVLQIAIRSRPIDDRMILVSDAMASWNGPDAFELYGRTIQLQDGKLINSEGALAGAHIDLAQSLRRAITILKIAPEQALRMVTHNPVQLMKLSAQCRLKLGAINDLVFWDSDWKVRQVWAKDPMQ